MELELSDEQQALRNSVRDVLRSECPISLVRRVVEEGKGSEELWARMIELDWPALAVPEADGGLGLGFVEVAVVCEELGRALCPAPFLATVTQFVPIVRAVTTQRDAPGHALLRAVAGDGAVGTLALAEATGRWDLGAVQSTAERRGGGWMLRGEKRFVYDAAVAQELAVVARAPGTADEQGLGVFAVPQEYVEVRPLSSLDATRQLATVVLDDVVIGHDRVLAEPGVAAGALSDAVAQSVAALAAEMVGTSQAVFDIVLAYVKEREQFGVKIGSFQAIKHKMANMYVALESARATAYFAAAAIAEDDERRTLAVAMAKASAADCQKLLAQEAIQCLGGIGYTWEHDMHLYVKRLKAANATFGTGADHRDRVARMLGM